MKFSEEEKAMFARSAEQLRADENQRLLFAPEAGPAEEPGEPGREDTTPVKPHERKKARRKPLDPKLPRVDKTIDIPEHEKTCACGACLTKIGGETSGVHRPHGAVNHP